MGRTYPTWPEVEEKYYCHNIMFLVGNGFDLRMLQALGVPRSTSYEAFYRFLECSLAYGDPYEMKDNVIFNRIKRNRFVHKQIDELADNWGKVIDNDDRKELREICDSFKSQVTNVLTRPEAKAMLSDNWSDFEQTIGELLRDDAESHRVKTARDQIQKAFVFFLQEIVTNDLLISLNEYAMEQIASSEERYPRPHTRRYGRAQWSLSRFLGDLNDDDMAHLRTCQSFGFRDRGAESDPYRHCIVGQRVNHDMMNYLFVNFNYTELLDNFIYLDSSQFSPHPYRSSNYWNFDTDPHHKGKYSYKGWEDERRQEEWDYDGFCKSYVEIVHPHGTVSVPRSVLFGVSDYADPGDDEMMKKTKSVLSKPYLAQAGLKYQCYFDDTKLFVLFGLSLGESDRWWWEHVMNRLADDPQVALIVYWYDPEAVSQRSKERDQKARKEVLDRLKNYTEEDLVDGDETACRIAVVGFNDATQLAMFSTVPALEDEPAREKLRTADG